MLVPPQGFEPRIPRWRRGAFAAKLRRHFIGALSRSRTCTMRGLNPPPLPIGLSARTRSGIRTRTDSDLSRPPLPLGYAGESFGAGPRRARIRDILHGVDSRVDRI